MLRLPKFRYLQPESVSEAVRMMADSGTDAMFVSGGTDLYPNMKRRQQTPTIVIGLAELEELRFIKGEPKDGMVLGAGATLTDITKNSQVRAAYPAVARASELISTPQLRNVSTIGGNLLLDTRCNYYDQTYEWRKGIHFCMKKIGDICWVAPSSPRCWAVQSSDNAPVMVAIGAKVKLVSAFGERMISAESLYNDDGMEYLTKRRDELLTEVHLPPTNGWKATYWKLRRRGSFDFPVLGVAVRLLQAADGTVEDAKIILGGVGSHPIEAKNSEKVIIGKILTEDVVQEAAAAAYAFAKPLDNTDFHMAWRKEMTKNYVAGTLRELAGLPPTFPKPEIDHSAHGTNGANGSSGLRIL